MNWQSEYGIYLGLSLIWAWGYYQTWSSDCALATKLQEDRFVRVPLAIWLLCLGAKSRNAPTRVMAVSGYALQVVTLTSAALLAGLNYMGMGTLIVRVIVVLVVALIELIGLGKLVAHMEYHPKRR